MERVKNTEQIADYTSREGSRSDPERDSIAHASNAQALLGANVAAGNADVDRGWNGYMQYINALIGCSFIIIALFYALHPSPLAWAPYSVAALLSLISLKTEISIAVSRVLAVGTTALMFFFFAGFFVLVPNLAADWYTSQEGWQAVCRIFGAFAMIPILSDYSCRLKAECREARHSARRAFFSAPDHVHPNN